jgi:membrane protein implicated in regulation of membrane protease activity
MPWWGWVLIGTMLLAGELFVVEADFYLVFLGVSALAVGLLGAVGLGGPLWLQWLLFAGIAVVSTVLFRQRVYHLLRPPGGEVGDSVVGEWAVARGEIAPGALGRAELRGTLWDVRNAGMAPIAPGGRMRVEGRDGLVLVVRAAE